SLVWVDQHPITLFSYWTANDPNPVCQDLLLLEQKSALKNLDYENCAPNLILASRGFWTVQALDALDGRKVYEWPKAYLWGRLKNFFPDKPYTLLVETFSRDDGKLRFDRANYTPDVYKFVSVQSDLQLHEDGSLPNPGSVPTITNNPTNYRAAVPAGFGYTWGGIPELMLRDIDNDGLNELQLQGGTWIGYSDGQIIRKP